MLEWGLTKDKKISMKNSVKNQDIFEDRLVFFVNFTKIMFKLIYQSGMHLFPLFIHIQLLHPDTEYEVQKI